MSGVPGTPPHTTSRTCGVCHVIGGPVAGTTTFNMAGVATHMNGTVNIRADLPTANCSNCHGGLPPNNGIHPTAAQKSYITSCSVCHPVGAGNPISMSGVSTHNNGVINFNP
jgi:hypothetical protein